MAIELEDLSPEYQRQALRKWAELERSKKSSPAPGQDRAPPRARGGKYKNRSDTRTAEDGTRLRFDSRKEARRFDILSARLRAGEIRDLKLQADFTLQEAYTTPEGVRVRAIRYRADFVYEERTASGWETIVEDVKSPATKTRVYAMKKKLLREKFGLDVRET